MGQTNSSANTKADVLIRKNIVMNEEDNYDYEKLSKMSKDELLDHIRDNMDIKPFYHDAEFKKLLSKLIIINEELVPFSIELYQKIRTQIPYVLLKDEDAKQSIVSKAKYNKIYIKPKFSIEQLKESLDDSDLPVEASKPIDFGKVEDKDKFTKFDDSLISLTEFNESFRLISSSKDMLGITKQLLNDLSDYQKLYIISQYNKIFNGKGNVENLSIGRASYMYKPAKKGPTDKISSFRQIVVIPTVVNHFHRMISLRLNNYYGKKKYIDSTMQKGGVMNQSFGIFEQIYKVKRAIKNANQQKKKACVVFLDMSNAFGSLALDRLYDILEKFETSPKIIDYLKRFYGSFKYYIEAGDIKYGPVNWKRGLIQGCPLSPMLFCLALGYVLNDVDRTLKNTHGFKYEDGQDLRILFSAYMDDICIITEDSTKMKNVLDNLLPKLKQIGLLVNSDKSAVMYINHEDSDLKIDNAPEVSSYKYLGEYLSSNSTTDESFSLCLRELAGKLYQIDRKNKLTNDQKSSVFFKSIMPWLQRKMLAMFDAPQSEKIKLLNLINIYMTKWCAEKEMSIFTMVKSVLGGTNDEVIKKLDLEEDNKASGNVSNDISILKTTFKENNVNFSYESINDSDNIDLLLEKMVN